MTAVDFAAFVDRLAQVSSEVILPFFRSSIGAEDKSRRGVRSRDRSRPCAQAAMRRLISQTFPAHGVIGEEYGVDRPDAEYVLRFSIPSTARKSFISGLPTWGTLIGLMHRGRPVYGDDVATIHTRTLFRRRQTHAGSLFPGYLPRRESAFGMDDAHAAHALLPIAGRSHLDDDQPAPDQGGRDPTRAAYRAIEADARLVRYGGDCYAYCAAGGRFSSISSSKPISSRMMSSRWYRSSRARAAKSPPGTAAKRRKAAESSPLAILHCTRNRAQAPDGVEVQSIRPRNIYEGVGELRLGLLAGPRWGRSKRTPCR